MQTAFPYNCRVIFRTNCSTCSRGVDMQLHAYTKPWSTYITMYLNSANLLAIEDVCICMHAYVWQWTWSNHRGIFHLYTCMHICTCTVLTMNAQQSNGCSTGVFALMDTYWSLHMYMQISMAIFDDIHACICRCMHLNACQYIYIYIYIPAMTHALQGAHPSPATSVGGRFKGGEEGEGQGSWKGWWPWPGEG